MGMETARGAEPRNSQCALRIGSDIAARLMDLGVAAIALAAHLPRDPVGRHVAQQLVRAATAAGANYEEARAAESREDFVHKVGVAAKEAREACYWLELIRRAGWVPEDVAPKREAAELAAILGASARTARLRANRE